MDHEKEAIRHKCEFCNLKLENYHLWTEHLRQFHNVVFQQCEYCRLKFPTKSALLNHVNSKHTNGRNPRVECSRCPATFLNVKGLDKHVVRRHKPNQPTFKCKECGNMYKSQDAYKKHLKLAHVPLTYLKCDKCPKLFYRKHSLRRHQEVEHSKNFQRTQCSMCPATYKYREHLSRHIQEKHFSHVKEGISNQSLLTSDNKCNICGELFEDKSTLLEHRKSVHNRRIEIFHCTECPAVFKIREAYENHLRDDHQILVARRSNVDSKDYICQDYVDFEYTMLQNFELRQLMNVRKTRKFSQKLVIVTYSQDKEKNVDQLDVTENELETITLNVKTFFDSLLSQYRTNTNISEINHVPIQFYMEIKEREKTEPEIKYVEIEISGQPEKTVSEDNLRGVLAVNQLSDAGSKTTTKTITKTDLKNLDNKSKHLKKALAKRSSKRAHNGKSVNKKETINSKLNDLKTNPQAKTKTTLGRNKTENSPLHKCIYCAKLFKLKALLVRHIKYSHKNKSVIATQEKLHKSIDGFEQETSETSDNSGNFMFPCKHCQALFPCKELLLNHCLWEHSTATVNHSRMTL